jgi:hypothetical protein
MEESKLSEYPDKEQAILSKIDHALSLREHLSRTGVYNAVTRIDAFIEKQLNLLSGEKN